MRPRRFLLLALPLAVLVGLDPGPAHAGAFRCGTPEILGHLPELRALPRPVDLPRLGGKLVRDGFGSHTTRTSTNFTVNTGNFPVSDAQAQLVLDTAEASWARYVDQLGFTPPIGTNTYKLNIYLSWDTDNPSIDYDGGYATLDNQGYPYLVISKNLVTDAGQIQGVVSHEFFHDFQFSFDAYSSGSAQWYWEATAEWGAMEVYPGLSDPFSFVGALALTQELPLYYFGDPFATDPTGQHQYGAGLFPHYLSTRLALPSIVIDSWETASGFDDPIDVLGGLIPNGAIPGGIDEAVDDFSARNALWDYDDRALMLPWIATFESTYPSYHQLTAPLIFAAGTHGFVDPAPGRPLHELGAHQFVLSAPADHVLDLAIQGQPTGSQGTAATWSATLVRTSPTDGILYTPFVDGALTVTLPPDEGSARLVVTVHGEGRNESETFPYLLRVGADPGASPDAGVGADAGPDPETGDGGGCCSSTHGGAGGSLLLALGVVIAMRRRVR